MPTQRPLVGRSVDLQVISPAEQSTLSAAGPQRKLVFWNGPRHGCSGSSCTVCVSGPRVEAEGVGGGWRRGWRPGWRLEARVEAGGEGGGWMISLGAEPRERLQIGLLF